jgi:hypothetical protein
LRVGDHCPIDRFQHGEVFMGKQARVGLLLGATACLVAVMIDWVIQEL